MSPTHSQHDRARAPRRLSALAAFALVLVLVAAQTLGLWHRTEHASASGQAEALSHDGHRVAAPSAGGHASLTAHVFGHDAGESAPCRLFDQQTLADSLPAIAVVLPVFEPVRAGVVPLVNGGTRLASTPYQARAPPSVS